MGKAWARVVGPNRGKRTPRYVVKGKGLIFSDHRTKLGAKRSKARLEKRFPTAASAVHALASRNYRPFGS